MLNVVSVVENMPAWLRRLVFSVISGRGVVGRVVDAARFRFSEQDVPAVPHVSTTAIRLVIGPVNEAGQGYEWARAVERSVPAASALVVREIGRDPFAPTVDLSVPVAVYQRSRVWHEGFEAYLSSQTHIIWESGFRLLGRRYRDAAQEAAWFAQQGVRGAFLFHGSDIRPPSRHAALNRWSPFRASGGPARVFEDTARRNAALAVKADIPVFVSTPDLLQWVPGSTWCPVVVDAARWQVASTQERPRDRLVVVHAPSQRWLKGTDHIEPVLHQLAEEGVIEYRQVTGIPHASMPEFYAASDVVLDQFALGSYGVAACEAMASGRLVMGHVDEATRAHVREAAGLELPVHEATIDTLETELRRVAAEPEAFETYRMTGPAFVREVHDGRRSAAALAPFLGVSASMR